MKDNKTLNNTTGLIILVLVIVLMTISFKAKSSDLCQAWATQAEGIIIARQDGMPLAVINQRLKETKEIAEEAKPTLQIIINDAYSAPIKESLADKIQIVRDFSDYVLVACIQQTKDKV